MCLVLFFLQLLEQPITRDAFKKKVAPSSTFFEHKLSIVSHPMATINGNNGCVYVKACDHMRVLAFFLYSFSKPPLFKCTVLLPLSLLFSAGLSLCVDLCRYLC